MKVTVLYGPNQYPINIDRETTPRIILDDFAETFDLPDDAEVRVNGTSCGMDVTLRVNDRVEFVKKTGDKG